MAEEELPQKNHRLVKTLCFLAVFFSTIGAIMLILWLHYWRYEETTDDAYVNGNSIQVNPQVSAQVISYFVDNTQFVEMGQPLVHLERTDFEVALKQKLADLGQNVRQIRQLIERTAEQKAILDQRRFEHNRLRLEYERRRELVSTGAVAQEDFTNALLDMEAAQEAVVAADFEYKALLAMSKVSAVVEHPLIVSSIQSVKQAYLDLKRTIIYAPVSGFVAQRAVQVGHWVKPTDTLLWIIPFDQVWVDANFKETQLANVRVGQPVEIISDIYGSSAPFHGTVVGIGGGTGSVFSILPPQNATGNWIKIVQRIPVKISLLANEIKEYPLSLGLSMTCTIDTHERDGARVNSLQKSQIVQQTAIYNNELEGVEPLIEAALLENGAYHS